MKPSLKPTVRPRTALALLLARYIAGEIAEQTWQRISALLDDEELSPEERLAFAAHLAEAWRPERAGQIPTAEEAHDFLMAWRETRDNSA